MSDSTARNGLGLHIPRIRHHRGKITVDFPDCELSQFLCQVAENWEMRVCVPAELIGLRVDVLRKNVDWSDLFDAVLIPLGYDWFMERGVIQIALSDGETEPPYTDFEFLLFHTKATEVESILRLFLNPYDKELMEILPDDHRVRFHVRKSRLESLAIFIENIDETFNPNPSDGSGPSTR